MNARVLGTGLATAALVLGLAGCSSSAETKSDSSSASTATDTATAQKQEETAQSDYEVTIDSAQLAKDYEGKDAVIVTFTFTNNSEDTTSFLAAVNVQCYQNGVQLDTAIVTDGVDTGSSMNNVKPGASTQVQMAYELDDTSTLEVEVYELFSLSKTPIATKDFELA